MAPVYIGLVHYPIYNKHMEVVTTALTNYDLHDIARTAKTYGVRTYFIIHPIESQREMALRIMTHWKTADRKRLRRKADHCDYGCPCLPEHGFLYRYAEENP